MIHSQNQECNKKFGGINSNVDEAATNSFVYCYSMVVMIIRIFSDILCLKYSSSSSVDSSVEITNLFFFIISLLGLVFTFIFVVSCVYNLIQKSETKTKNHKFEAVFCVLWSMLYGFFATLDIFINKTVIVPVVCGYLSMICYALDGYWKCTREKKFNFQNKDTKIHENYCPI